MNKWYEYGWWLLLIGYPVEWGVPALLWIFPFFVKKIIPIIYASWLMWVVSLTLWAVNLGVSAFWLGGALTYTTGCDDSPILFTRTDIWIELGAFMGYAVFSNSIYYWLFHQGARHPLPDPDTTLTEDDDDFDIEDTTSLGSDFFGF